MRLNTYKESCFWNNRTYGSAFKVSKWTLKGIIVSLGVVIPVLVPIPLVLYIANKWINNDMVIRYEK